MGWSNPNLVKLSLIIHLNLNPSYVHTYVDMLKIHDQCQEG